MGRHGYIRRLASVPPFTNVTVREKVLRTVRLLKRYRRLAYERMGSGRFSRPAIHALDAKLGQHLPDGPGVFVEAGAHDGYTASNTYYLERFKGWTGVLVEPIPELYRQCVRERPRSRVMNCALVAENGSVPVAMTYRGPRSRLAAAPPRSDCPDPDHLDWERSYSVSVPARTLTSVLDEAKVDHIDLLVIDVEGFEVDALRGLDLDRYAPQLMLIETNGAERELGEVLGDRYRLVAELSPTDALFEKRV
jgi:FkbM family methyltransferase